MVALVSGLILIAVPLYLWRRPSIDENAGADAGSAASSAIPLVDAGSVVITPVDAAIQDERVRLGTPQKVQCSAGPGATGQAGTLCDSLAVLEQALAKAIRENVECAPRGAKEGSINYVLTVDFAKKSLHVFPGASGSWKGPQARRAAQCVKRSLPQVTWDTLQHQYRYYRIAILATYSATGGAAGAAPMFE